MTLGNGLYINLGISSSMGSIIAFQVIAATGAGLLFQPPLVALQALVPPHKTASATATLGVIRSLSTSTSIIVSGVLFSSGMDSRRSTLLEKGLAVDLANSFSGSTAAANVFLIKTISDPGLQTAIKESFASSLREVWILCTCIAACAVIASTLISNQKLSDAHEEFRTGLENL